MSKRVTLLLIVFLAASILVLVENVFAQSVPRPSVPEFTLEFVDYSYDVQPQTTSTKDPYTNETTTTTIPGYHVKNFTIQLTITNQPFPSRVNGNKTNLYYNVRVKGNYEEDWNNLYSSSLNSSSYFGVLSGSYYISLPEQSSSDYTVLSFPANSYTSGGLADFQVEAILGYQYSYDEYFYNQQPHLIPIGVDTFVYAASGWSETQTLRLGDSQTPTPEATPTPTSTGELPTSDLTPIVGAVIVAVVIGAGLGLLPILSKENRDRLQEVSSYAY